MIHGEDLPAVNACLNSLSAVLVLVGYFAIRVRAITLHKALMLSAVVVSAIFLASYLYYHFVVKGGQPTRFPSDTAPTAALIYYAILLSHTLLAIAVAPMVLITVYLGLRDRLAGHIRLARWTLPIWLYVSVTGVIVYVMLYQLYPPA
jgi:putative membrane protein